MGIDIHNLNFLAYAQDRGVRFTRTLGIGRQALFIEPDDLELHRSRRGLIRLADAPRVPSAPRYFEPLMTQWFGAEVVHSVDASAYENASFVHDMNLPWPEALPVKAQYDAVLDFGCLEHVFNFPTAWQNCVDACAVGGHVLHAVPTNNLQGHGFYQFSAELFFNLYQAQRGFELVDLVFAMKADPRVWWRVANPMDVRRRVNLCNGHEVYMLVLARKTAELPHQPAPQQSDYAQADWLGQTRVAEQVKPSRWQQPLATLGLLAAARRWRARLAAVRGAGLALPQPDFARLDVGAMISR